MTSRFFTRTAPTIGLGEVSPYPRLARLRARRINAMSAAEGSRRFTCIVSACLAERHPQRAAGVPPAADLYWCLVLPIRLRGLSPDGPLPAGCWQHVACVAVSPR